MEIYDLLTQADVVLDMRASDKPSLLAEIAQRAAARLELP